MLRNQILNVKIKAEQSKPTFVRFSYKHDNKASLGAEFFLAILPIDPNYLTSYASNYLIDPANGWIELQTEDEVLKFGNGYDIKKVEINEENQVFSVR